MPRWKDRNSNGDRFRRLRGFSILGETCQFLRKFDNRTRALSCSFTGSRTGTVIASQ